MAWNGFYNMKKVKAIKSFYLRAVLLSYEVRIDHLPGTSRERDSTKSIREVLQLVSKDTHNVCIDREAYYGEAFYGKVDNVGEVGFSTLGANSIFLFCFMNRENLEKLIKEFNLEKLEY